MNCSGPNSTIKKIYGLDPNQDVEEITKYQRDTGEWVDNNFRYFFVKYMDNETKIIKKESIFNLILGETQYFEEVKSYLDIHINAELD